MYELLTGAEQAFGIKIPVSRAMQRALELWYQMYVDKAPWKFYKDGDKNVCERSLKIPASVASELARLTTLELSAEISGSKRAEYLDRQFKQNVMPGLRSAVEYAAAFGGVIFKPHVTVGDGISVRVVLPGDFFPVEFSGNDITAAVFASVCQHEDTRYTRLEYHQLSERDDGKYNCTIQNKCFAQNVSSSGRTSYDKSLGTEVPLSMVPEWEEIEPEVNIDGIQHALFSYYKMPFANTVDTLSPLGVSCYARAVDQIRLADQQLNRMEWEYVATEAAVYVDNDFLEQDDYGNPKPLPKNEERLYRTYSGDMSGGTNGKSGPITIYGPAIRVEPLIAGIDFYKREIEFQCGLAYGTISDPQAVDKTAEEVKNAKQRSYSTVKDMQTSLDKALSNLVLAMNELADLYGLAPDGEYELSFEWDDGIVVDRSKWFAEMMSMVSAGLVKPEVLVSQYFNCSEEEAQIKYLPSEENDVMQDDEE